MNFNKHTIALLFITACMLFIVPIQAQVTIGSGTIPNQEALLDLKENSNGESSKGLLLPRVSLTSTALSSPLSTHIAGMSVYNQATTNDVTPGYYYNDGTKWQRLATEDSNSGSSSPKFFYMPAVVIPTDTGDPGYNSTTKIFTVDLYTAYASQFGLTDSSSTLKNTSASTTLPIVASNKLDYFITYYDNTVFENVGLSDTGVLTYKLSSGYVITENTFMNILFQEK